MAVMPLCVYAIVARPFSRRTANRAGGAGVRPVNARSTAAVVSDCQGPLRPTVRALRGHDRIVRSLAREASAILPVRFGTLVDSEQSLIKLLDAWSDELQKALAAVDRHCQMTLRLFAKEGAAAQSRPLDPAVVPAGSPEAAETAQQETRPGTRYLTRRARAQAVATSAPELEPLREALAPIVAAERIVRHDQNPLILTAYHLIPRSAVSNYRRLLRRQTDALPYRAALSGPWPPYAFVPELR
jgi:hypothetical protein